MPSLFAFRAPGRRGRGRPQGHRLAYSTSSAGARAVLMFRRNTVPSEPRVGGGGAEARPSSARKSSRRTYRIANCLCTAKSSRRTYRIANCLCTAKSSRRIYRIANCLCTAKSSRRTYRIANCLCTAKSSRRTYRIANCLCTAKSSRRTYRIANCLCTWEPPQPDLGVAQNPHYVYYYNSMPLCRYVSYKDHVTSNFISCVCAQGVVFL